MDSEQEKPKRKKYIDVAIVEAQGESCLVQWIDKDKLNRVYVPVDAIKDGKCEQETLKAGVPYGSRWGEFCHAVEVTPQQIEQALYRAGFWTHQDIERKPLKAQRVVSGLIGVSVTGLARSARNLKREVA